MTRTPCHLSRARDGAGRALGCALLLVAGLAASGTAQPQPRIAMDDPSWRLESTRDGIALYSAEVPGTGIVPWKAVMAALKLRSERSLSPSMPSAAPICVRASGVANFSIFVSAK